MDMSEQSQLFHTSANDIKQKHEQTCHMLLYICTHLLYRRQVLCVQQYIHI